MALTEDPLYRLLSMNLVLFLRIASVRRCIMSIYTVSELAMYVNRSYRHAGSSLGAVSLLFWVSGNKIFYTDNIFDNTLR